MVCAWCVHGMHMHIHMHKVWCMHVHTSLWAICSVLGTWQMLLLLLLLLLHAQCACACIQIMSYARARAYVTCSSRSPIWLRRRSSVERVRLAPSASARACAPAAPMALCSSDRCCSLECVGCVGCVGCRWGAGGVHRRGLQAGGPGSPWECRAAQGRQAWRSGGSGAELGRC